MKFINCIYSPHAIENYSTCLFLLWNKKVNVFGVGEPDLLLCLLLSTCFS